MIANGFGKRSLLGTNLLKIKIMSVKGRNESLGTKIYYQLVRDGEIHWFHVLFHPVVTTLWEHDIDNAIRSTVGEVYRAWV